MDGGIQLYLVRHGVAGQRGEAWPDDTKRPLTPDGAARLRREGRGLRDLGVRFDQVFTSPLVRTRQTAEILAQALAPDVAVVNVDALAPGGTPAATLAALGGLARPGAIAVVGHEPDLGELAARLVGARVVLPFKKGAVCRIDLETLPPARVARLIWFATPKMLRRIGPDRS